MSQEVPTIKVKTDSPDNEQGFYLINEDEFDPEIHDKYEDSEDEGEDKPKKLTKAEQKRLAEEQKKAATEAAAPGN